MDFLFLFTLFSFFFFAESNAGSVTQLVTSEQPLAIAPAVHKQSDDQQIQYKSHPDLNPQSDFLYKPLMMNNKSNDTLLLSKAHSFSDNLHIDNNVIMETKVNLDDLHLDPIVLPENYKVMFVNNDSNKQQQPQQLKSSVKYDNDLTVPEKENNMLSATRLRLLQDTTMIESALDLDSLDDSSLGTNSQAGLMKVGV